jgi:hypothetical protein
MWPTRPLWNNANKVNDNKTDASKANEANKANANLADAKEANANKTIADRWCDARLGGSKPHKK